MDSKKIAVVSISGGKDSTSLILLALEKKVNARFVFADTGHEHAMTYEYISYLEKRLNITIDVVKADFSKQIEKKKSTVLNKWVDDGAVTESEAKKIAAQLQPTGIPFLDLCLWKGRFPSTRARFCSSELKHEPLDRYMMDLIKQGYEVESWQGVRADESLARKNLPVRERGDLYPIYRPILHWTVEDVFAMHDKHNVKPNPLYKLGMSRVGCMPCIHARKGELTQIAQRFPEEVARVAEWESLVSKVSKRGNSTFFHASTDPTVATQDNNEISISTHGIDRIFDWASTSRGGRQYQLQLTPKTMCHSIYGLCE